MARLVKQSDNDAYVKSTRYNKNSINNQPSVYQNEEEESLSRSKKCVNFILESPVYKVLILLLTIYTLFAEDFRLAFCPMNSDIAFQVLTILSFIIFIFDLVFTYITFPKIIKLTYYWLDWISTMTILTDQSVGLTADLNSKTVNTFLRVLRLIRLMRLFKLFRVAPKRAGRSHTNQGNLSNITNDKKEKEKPTKVGQVFSELATCRVILISLLMISGIYAIQGFPEYDATGIYENTRLVHKMQLDYKVNDRIFGILLNQMVNSEAGLMYFRLCNRTCPMRTIPSTMLSEDKFQSLLKQYTTNNESFWHYNELTTEEYIGKNYRSHEIVEYIDDLCFDDDHMAVSRPSSEPPCETKVIYNIKDFKQSEAGLNMIKTLLIIILLGWSSLMFAQDAHTLVIRPIERMMKTVNDLAANPLSAVYMSKNQKTAQSTAYETALLEKTLNKVGNLLCIGFGEAGAEIIIKNLSGDCSLNVFIAGRRMAAIFGFCDIRSFTSITECLQEDVLKFVNTVASIVHNNVSMFGGAANKNIGDAFLLVWKISVNPKMPANKWRNSQTEIIASNALSAFLQSIISIDESNRGVSKIAGTQLKEFVNTTQITDRFGVGYQIQIGYGLHVGWAIEGAIGTDFKIDASYLSKNANMAEQIQDLSPVYHLPLLMSGEFWYILPFDARARCRHIDRVKFAGSTDFTDIYTFDITNLHNVGDLLIGNPKENRIDYSFDPCIESLQDGLSKNYMTQYEEAVKFYIKGDWQRAKVVFDKLSPIKPGDGGMRLVMSEMEKMHFQAKNWLGYRCL